MLALAIFVRSATMFGLCWLLLRCILPTFFRRKNWIYICIYTWSLRNAQARSTRQRLMCLWELTEQSRRNAQVYPSWLASCSFCIQLQRMAFKLIQRAQQVGRWCQTRAETEFAFQINQRTHKQWRQKVCTMCASYICEKESFWSNRDLRLNQDLRNLFEQVRERSQKATQPVGRSKLSPK